MNIITIDPSLSCTAMVVNDKKFVYTTSHTSSTKTGKLKKWFERCEPLINIRTFDYVNSVVYSDQEISKLADYKNVVNTICADIMANIKQGEDSRVGIEGYSYSSQAGPLIDLVCFGTLLRNTLLGLGFSDIKIFAPTTLKKFSSELTYQPVIKGKQVKWVNHDGVAGGSFKKPEMYKCLTDNPSFTCEWVTFLRDNQKEIFESSNIPKPIEDLNDAKLMFEVIKNSLK